MYTSTPTNVDMATPRLQDRDFDVFDSGLLLVLASGGALRCLHLNSEAAAGLWARETPKTASEELVTLT